ncbi:MAG: hypothetical protein HRU09_09865 [Oligoflexales bacterium]|nr:hypothetical protein [Oligoflexales bacterium]
MFLALNVDGHSVEDVYLVGDPKTEISYEPLPSNPKVLAVKLPKGLEVNPSLVVTTNENMGIKTPPLDLTKMRLEMLSGKGESLYLADADSQGDPVKKNLAPTVSVELSQMRSVTGVIHGFGSLTNPSVNIAGTKLELKGELMGSDGEFTIENVPPGNFNFSIAHEKNAILLPFHAEDTENIQNIVSELSFKKVCDGFRVPNLKTPKFTSFKDYQRTSEDFAVDFKNKYDYSSKETASFSRYKIMAICDIRIILTPKKKNFFYANDLIFALNDNLLYTHHR